VIWATTNTAGVDAGDFQEESGPSPSVLAWGIIAQFDSVIGINSALLVTVPDLARYSKTPNAQVWGQLIALPVAQTICGAFGVLATVSKGSWTYVPTDETLGRSERHVWEGLLESIRSARVYTRPLLYFESQSWCLLCVRSVCVCYSWNINCL
jgi:hypothetical protein